MTQLSAQQEKELRQAAKDYRVEGKRIKAKQIIDKYVAKYPKDKLVSNKLSEKKKFDEENMKQ